MCDIPITLSTAAELERVLLPTVGASRRIDCNGSWVESRDAVDRRLVTEYQTNTGRAGALAANESEVGGFPVLARGTACVDTDHDGMPDAWESARGLSPTSAADGNLVGADGYTNLERFLNGM